MAPLTSLYLASLDPYTAPELDRISDVLRRLEIIGTPIGDGRFTAGPGFDHHVVFAGCSPHLVLQPPADGSQQFCHVALHGPFDTPRLIVGPNTTRPRCPVCRARYTDWQDRLEDWQSGRADAHCAQCGHRVSPHRLDWRGQAISGRLLIELRNVFPGEASPSDRLLSELRNASCEDWRYAWAAYLDS